MRGEADVGQHTPRQPTSRRRHGPTEIVLAGLVGMSRVVLGVHYPGDVLTGQLIAILSAVLVLLSTGPL